MNNFIEIPANKASIERRKLVSGYGINDADYITSQKINGKIVRCQFYTAWRNMLKRCFDKKFHKSSPTYIGCTVSEGWLIFSNFKSWMELQDWQGNALDKDIINPGNKHYSPDNCLFVSQELNSLLTDHGNKRGKYPCGVSYNKASKKFQSECNVDGERKRLGFFATYDEASNIYKKFKSTNITRIANQQTDERIKKGLLRHAYLIAI